jgi:hypothetical protein
MRENIECTNAAVSNEEEGEYSNGRRKKSRRMPAYMQCVDVHCGGVGGETAPIMPARPKKIVMPKIVEKNKPLVIMALI